MPDTINRDLYKEQRKLERLMQQNFKRTMSDSPQEIEALNRQPLEYKHLYRELKKEMCPTTATVGLPKTDALGLPDNTITIADIMEWYRSDGKQRLKETKISRTTLTSRLNWLAKHDLIRFIRKPFEKQMVIFFPKTYMPNSVQYYFRHVFVNNFVIGNSFKAIDFDSFFEGCQFYSHDEEISLFVTYNRDIELRERRARASSQAKAAKPQVSGQLELDFNQQAHEAVDELNRQHEGLIRKQDVDSEVLAVYTWATVIFTKYSDSLKSHGEAIEVLLKLLEMALSDRGNERFPGWAKLAGTPSKFVKQWDTSSTLREMCFDALSKNSRTLGRVQNAKSKNTSGDTSAAHFDAILAESGIPNGACEQSVDSGSDGSLFDADFFRVD